jgi:hypothetical protein
MPVMISGRFPKILGKPKFVVKDQIVVADGKSVAGRKLSFWSTLRL